MIVTALLALGYRIEDIDIKVLGDDSSIIIKNVDSSHDQTLLKDISEVILE